MWKLVRDKLFLIGGFRTFIKKDIEYRKCFLDFKKKYDTKIFPANTFSVKRIAFIGKHSYGPISVFSWEGEERLHIGSFVSIASDCLFLLGGNHNLYRASTYPFHIDFDSFPKVESLSKGNIVIKDDVWIGTGSMILSGVTVGQGAVIAACSVVTKDVKPYSVVGGNPAKLIKYRFDEELRRECMRVLDYSKFTDDFMNENIELFLSTITFDVLNKIEKSLTNNNQLMKKK